MRTFLTFRRLRGCGLLGVAVAACLASSGSLRAQPEAAGKATATATFLDRKQPEGVRLEALKQLGYPEDAMLPALLRIGTDRREDDTIRREALKLVRYGDLYLAAVLKILADPNDGGEELDAGLIEDLSRRTTFRLPAKDAQLIQSVERKLLSDKRDKVRLYAYRALVSNHDSVALDLLTESLRRGKNFPIPLPDAIDLLDQDGAVSYIALLRPYLTHNDPLVQAQAARALAVDPQSRPQIVELARSSATAAATRLHALRALSREDDRFPSYAIPLVADARENPEVRYAAMHDLAGRLNYGQVDAADQIRFAQTVEKIALEEGPQTDGSRKLQEGAKQLHAYLKEAFPEIRKFYAKP